MYEGRRVLVVVPARGGSQGVKLKNLREIGGVPLVGRAAQIAKALAFVDRAVVSGLDVPFMRPDDISGAIISDWQVLTHALAEMERIDGVTFDIVVMLQPTSPSRTPEQVRATVERLVSGGFDAVWTVSETDSKAHPIKQFRLGANGKLDYYDPDGAKIIARQQLQPVYHRNGIAYAMTRSCLLDQGVTFGANTGSLLIEGELANIDTELDLLWANFLFERQQWGKA
jgi:CMP-N,N'-diacetyllegionaminic acid synthase